MKKIAKILLIAMLFSLFTTACGSAEQEVFDVDFSVSTEGIDLEGANIVYKVYVPSNYDVNNQILGYELDTIFADMAKQRLDDVEKNLNCTIELLSGNNASEYMTAAVSGTFISDAAMCETGPLVQAARVGMLIGLSELGDYIDYTNEAKWGYRNMLEIIAYEDDVFGLTPLLWPELSVYVRDPIVVNEDLITALGETDPREYIENKQWTWDVFEDCLGRYYVEEGGEVKHYSLTSDAGIFGSMFVFSNGSTFVEKNDKGEYVSGLYTEEARKAMQRGIEIFNGPNAHTICKQSYDAITDNLINGKTVLGPLRSYEIIGLRGRIAREMTNFGLLSWPHGPDVEPGYVFAYYSNIHNCIAFSRSTQQPEATAMAISALYEPFEEYPNMESVIDFLTKTYFFDRQDAEIYSGMYTNSYYMYFNEGMSGFLNGWIGSNKSVSEHLESYEDTVATCIEKYAAPAMRGLEAVYGDAE
ncbi:MAG: hypothetical protein E7477_08295 [Ruminococcaceae bacterium]|nr:hypothetical protein [Oscillospiraceae bacterium]